MLNRPTRKDSLRSATIVNASRRGSAVVVILIALGMAAVVAAVALWYLYGSTKTTGTNRPNLTTASLGPYENVVVEEGEVESSNNVEIRCEVKSKGSAGSNILWVIEAASMVKEGDLLVEFDSSALEDELSQQKIICNSTLALKVQADNVYQASVIAKTEYLEGAFEQERQGILSEIFIAEENLRRARQYAQYSEKLASKGYVTALQLEGDRFAVDKAKNELDLAKRKLNVLEQYTRAKTLKTLEADIAIAEAKLEAETESYEVELKKLEDIKTQIQKCKIYSPAAGQIVHANDYSSRGGAEFIVEPGATVREGQTIIRIPDPTSMQIKAKINEARITSVEEGMPVSIKIEALGDANLQGEVVRVNEYAEPTSWYMSNVKKYGTAIRILNPPKSLRPGLTAEVRIFVEQHPSVLQVPVQAVYASGTEAFALVKQGEGYETRRIEIGSSNDKAVLINSGLQAGDQVVMDPRSHVALFDLPDSATEPQMTRAGSFGPGSRGARGEGGGGEGGRGNRPRPNVGKSAAAPSESAPQTNDTARSGDAEQSEQQQANPNEFDPAKIVSRDFAAHDADGNGTISTAEFPEGQKEWFAKADSNTDGEITRAEMLAALQVIKSRMNSQDHVGAQ